MDELHDQLKVAFATYVKESERFEQEGIKVAAQRARKALSELNKLIVERRKEIQEKKQEM
jgi:hypothetical protein